MDFRRLKTFVTVAEHGTVSKAAALLHVTQPALSRQIGAFEQELGFKLFERSGRRLVLTPRGEQMLGDCRCLLAYAVSIDERAQALRRGDIRVLKIVASALTIGALFPEFLKEYAKRVPNVQLALVEADAADHFSMLENGEAHLAINVVNLVQPQDDRFGSYALPRFQLMAACAPTFDIEASDTIEIDKLAQHPLLLLDQSYATRNVFDAACRVAAVVPKVFMECSAGDALVALAAAGHGVAVIPSALKTDPRTIRAIQVTHRQEPLELTLAVLWNKRRTLRRYAEGFSELLEQYVRENFQVPKPRRAKVAAAAQRAPLRRSRQP
jgi:DNA-binding transcriptional LysR family regulator